MLCTKAKHTPRQAFMTPLAFHVCVGGCLSKCVVCVFMGIEVREFMKGHYEAKNGVCVCVCVCVYCISVCEKKGIEERERKKKTRKKG